MISKSDAISNRSATCEAGISPTPWQKSRLLRECRLDAARTHFVGKLPYEQYRQVLQVSAAHVYLTYPFVLSWSMLEAMASGCVVIGSRTAPVHEVIRDGENGWLVDFFDPEAIADKAVEVLGSVHQRRVLSAKARGDAATQYSRSEGLRAYDRLLAAAPALAKVDTVRLPALHVPVGAKMAPLAFHRRLGTATDVTAS